MELDKVDQERRLLRALEEQEKQAKDTAFRLKLTNKQNLEFLEESLNANEQVKILRQEVEKSRIDQELLDQEKEIATKKLEKVMQENAQLKKVMEKYQNELVQKNIQVAAVNEKLSTLQQEIDAKKALITNFERKIQKIETEGTTKEWESTKRISEMEGKLIEKDKRIVTQEDEKTQLLQTLKSLTKENKDGINLCKKLDNMCSQFENAWKSEKEKLKETEDELMETKSKVKECEEELNECKKCSAEISKWVKEENALSEGLRNTNYNLEKDKEQMTLMVGSLKNDLNELREKYIYHKNKNESLGMHIQEQTMKIIDKERKVKHLEDGMLGEMKRITELTEKNKKLETNIVMKNEELSSLTRKCDCYYKELTRLKENEIKSKEAEKELRKSLNEKADCVLRLENEKNKVQEQILEKNEKISKLVSEVKTMKQNCHKREAEIKDIGKYCESLEQREASTKSQNKKTAIDLRESLSKLQIVRQKNQSLIEETDRLQKLITKKDVEKEHMSKSVREVNLRYQETVKKLEELRFVEQAKDEEIRVKIEDNQDLQKAKDRMHKEIMKLMQDIQNHTKCIEVYKKRSEEAETAKKSLEKELRKCGEELRKAQSEKETVNNRIKESIKENNKEKKFCKDLQAKVSQLEQSFEMQRVELEEKERCRIDSISKISNLEKEKEQLINSRRISDERYREMKNHFSYIYKEYAMTKSDKERLIEVNKELERNIDRLENGMSEYKKKLLEKEIELKDVSWEIGEIQIASKNWEERANQVERERNAACDKQGRAENENGWLPDCCYEEDFEMEKTEALLQMEIMKNKELQHDLQSAISNIQAKEKQIESLKKSAEYEKDLYSEERRKDTEIKEELEMTKNELNKVVVYAKRCFADKKLRESTMQHEIVQLKKKLNLSESNNVEMGSKVRMLQMYTEELKRDISEFTTRYGLQDRAKIEKTEGIFGMMGSTVREVEALQNTNEMLTQEVMKSIQHSNRN